MAYGDLKNLDGEQRKVIKEIIRQGRKRYRHLPVKERRKAIDTALAVGYTESRYRNLKGGDRDSSGWRQERAMYYRNPRNLHASVKRFYDEYDADAPKGAPLGARAQAVQQSGTPRVWDNLRPMASKIREDFTGKGTSRGKGRSYSTKTTTVPGVDRSDQRTALKAAYLQNRHDPDALLALAQGLGDAKDTPARTVTTRTPDSGGRRDGRGRRTETDIERIAAKARSMGLRVSGNQGVQGHPETSGHTAGSYHYKRARKKGWQGALDISGDPRKMAELADYLSKRYGRDLEELIYRGPGSKDSHNIKRGRRVGKGFYSKHEDHVHAADID